MTRAPLVSVLIPCFNHSRYLREALDSVGTPKAPTEIVVVDDGSTDQTPDVLSAYRSPLSFTAVRQPNRGLAGARNRALRESRGEYIIFLDADDRLAPGAVDVGVDALISHPACAFVYGRCDFIDDQGRRVPTLHPPRILDGHYRELLRRNHIWMPALAAFRRDPLLRAGGFDPTVNAAADYQIYLHLARHYPVHDHGRLVAFYRRHTTNMSADSGLMLRQTLTVIDRERRFVRTDPELLEAYEEGRRNWQDYYGDELAAEIGVAVRQRKLAEVLAKAAVLGRSHPRGLLRHLGRKTRLTLRAAARGRRT